MTLVKTDAGSVRRGTTPPDELAAALSVLAIDEEYADGEIEQARRLGVRPLPRMTYEDLLQLAMRRFGPDHVLYDFVDEGVRLSVKELAERSREFAVALAHRGLRPGDAIAVWSPPAPLWPIAIFGAAAIGVRVCGLNTRYRAEELRQVLAVLDPALVFAATGFLGIDSPALLREALGDDRVERLIVAPVGSMGGDIADLLTAGRSGSGPRRTGSTSHRDAALIQFTSGSTAAPKGVLITQSGSVAAAHYGAECLGISPDDRMYSPLPFFHIGGTISTGLAAVTSGCTMVIPRRFVAADAARAIADGCTAFQGHGALWRMLLDEHRAEPRPLRGLRKGWASGDAHFLAEVRTELGVENLINMYGSSESGTIACTLPDDPINVRLGSLGHPTPGTNVRVVVPGTTDAVGPGELGELCLSGTMSMLGYLGARPVGDDWIRTGDLVRYEKGVLWYAGRTDDRLKPGGENVSVVEVEEFIRGDDTVEDVVVVGVPDHRLGEVPGAVVLVRGAETLDTAARAKAAEAVIERCRQGIAGFKVPRYVRVVDAMPMLETGKIDRRRVRAELLEHLRDDGADPL